MGCRHFYEPPDCPTCHEGMPGNRSAAQLWTDSRGHTRKIADAPASSPCRHPEHDPPSMRVFEPGTWEHTCPACKHRTVFTVRNGGML